MGPRSDERGNSCVNTTPNPELGGLQWGRARMSAEMTIPRVVPTAGIVASMGPRSDERGNQPMQLSASGSFKLQWGRARMSAEMVLLQFPGIDLIGLQWGRARMSAEICGSCAVAATASKLHWGRARMSAEIDGMTPAEVEREIASMGPRSDERGNELLVLDHRKDFAELQWGRARMSAEMPSRAPRWSANRALEWGRARMSAEIDGMTPAEVEREIASMGPRSDE